MQWQDELCPGCGQPRDECMDPDGPIYDAEAWRCSACEAKDSKAREFSDSGGSTAGLYFAVTTREEGL